MTRFRRTLLVAALLALPLPLGAAGDPARGARVFERCYSCHSVEPNENNLQGPNLRGVMGRRAGSLPGFEYSPAMIEAGKTRGLVWDDATLDAYLVNPEAVIAGTLMGPVMIDDAQDRQDLIEYLKRSAN